jgi:excisionase family DNA binding protein
MSRRCSLTGFRSSFEAFSSPMRDAVRVESSPFPPEALDDPEPRPTPPLLTIEETARRLRTSEKTIRRRIKEGVIRKAPIGGRLVRISSDEVDRLTAAERLPEPSE